MKQFTSTAVITGESYNASSTILYFLQFRKKVLWTVSPFYITSAFNLEISQSGSYVSHGILNWIISKTVWVRLWYWDFEQLWTIDIIKLKPNLQEFLRKLVEQYRIENCGKQLNMCGKGQGFFNFFFSFSFYYYLFSNTLYFNCNLFYYLLTYLFTYLFFYFLLCFNVVNLLSKKKKNSSNWLLHLNHPYPAHLLAFQVQLPFSLA